MFSKCIENCNKLIEGREEMMGRDSNALYQVIQSVYLSIMFNTHISHGTRQVTVSCLPVNLALF